MLFASIQAFSVKCYENVLSFYYLVIEIIKNSVLVELFPSLTYSHNITVLIILVLLLSVISLFLLLRYFGQHVVPAIKRQPRPPQAFRKRDKIRYHVTRFSRRFSEITEKLKKANTKEERRAAIVNFVRKVFKINASERLPALAYSRLPESFFEPDEEDDSTLPEDLRLMISSIRVFGHLEKSFFIDFCKFIETIHLNSNDYLFRIGDPDVNLYVIRSGKIKLYIKDSNGVKHILTEVGKGGSIESFLSVLNVITGYPSNYRCLEAVAVEPTTVLCLPTRSFIEIFKLQKAALFRIIQIIMVRLQRLSFNALHSYFNLGSELFKQNCPSTLCPSEANQYLINIFNAKPTMQSTVKITAPECLHPGMNKIELDDFSTVLDGINDTCTANISEPDALELGEAPQLHRRSVIQNPIASPSLPPSPRFEERKSLARRTQSTDFVVDSVSPSNTLNTNLCTHDDIPTDLSTEYSLESDELKRLLEAAEQDLAKLLNLEDCNLIHGYVSLVSVPAATTLAKMSKMQTEMYFVVYGSLEAIQLSSDGDTMTMFTCGPGDVAGLLGLLTGEPNIYTVRSVEKSVLAILPRERFYAVVRQSPESLYSVSHILSDRMSSLLHNLDFALEWVSVKAGKAIYKKGDKSSHVYVVLSGRLRQVENLADGGHRIVGELGRGDFVGFLEVICSQSRVNTVMAIRDSELAQIPSQLLHYLIQSFPQVLTRVIQLLSDKLLGNLKTTSKMTNPLGMPILQMTGLKSSITSMNSTMPSTGSTTATTTHGINPNSDLFHAQLNSSAMSNLHTIAVLPTTPDINAEAFTLELQHSMCPFGSTVRLTSHIVLKRLGSNAFDSVSQYRLSAWLSHQEELHRMVFFLCDCKRTSVWNRICIRQADCVLVLALGKSDPSKPSPIEMALKNDPTKVAKILILMYPLDTDHPDAGKTAIWLNNRPWISQHYHVRCEPRVFSARSHESLLKYYSRVFAHETPNPLSDFSRLTRYLTGEAVGLVLGGGGARGCSHVGLIRAFQESGIPIDIVGGTSIGAFMSALWAEETRTAQFTQRARNFTNCFNPIWNKIKDFTYPAVSLFSGKELNNQLESVFRDRQIEDLWLPCFCITTDISNCTMRIHTQGSVWRYVRASMSLSGYLPPLCDPYDGSLLLDGGYTNNLPADVMVCLGAKTIFANDVGAAVETGLPNFGDHLSGWYILYNRLIRTNDLALRIPGLTEIQARLAYISSVRQLEYVKASGICHYLRPPIDQFMTLQFSAFDKINSVGYEYTKEMLSAWYEDGRLKNFIPGLRIHISSPGLNPSTGPNVSCSSNSPISLNDKMMPSINTNWIKQSFGDQFIFVDLADCVARTSKTVQPESSASSESEHEVGIHFPLDGSNLHIIKDNPKPSCRSTVSMCEPTSTERTDHKSVMVSVTSSTHDKLERDSQNDKMHSGQNEDLIPSELSRRNRRQSYSENFYDITYLTSSESDNEFGQEVKKKKRRKKKKVLPRFLSVHNQSDYQHLTEFTQRNSHNMNRQTNDNIYQCEDNSLKKVMSDPKIDQFITDSFIEDGYIEDNESEEDSQHTPTVVSDPEWRHCIPYPTIYFQRPRFSSTSRMYLMSASISEGNEPGTNTQDMSIKQTTNNTQSAEFGEQNLHMDKQKTNRRLHHRSSLDKLRRNRDGSFTDST